MNKTEIRLSLLVFASVATFIGYRMLVEPGQLFSPATCEEFNTATPKYQSYFEESCGCLYPEQAAATDSPPVKNAVSSCFIAQMKVCRGWEKIAPIYRGCVEQVTGIVGK